MLHICQQYCSFWTKKKILKRYFLKKDIATSNQDFLFRPLYFVLNLSIHICSLCFLNCSLLLTFSKIVTSMSDSWCPGRLKCCPVAFERCLFVMYPLCSAILSWRLLWLSPMYCTGHFLHPIQYTIFLVWQFTWSVISAVKFMAVALTFAKLSPSPNSS